MKEIEQIQSNLVELITALMNEHGQDYWKGTCTDLCRMYNQNKKPYETVVPEQMGKAIARYRQELFENGIVHKFRHIAANRFHCFYRR